MKFTVSFSDGREIKWEGQDHDTVVALATELARGATFTVEAA